MLRSGRVARWLLGAIAVGAACGALAGPALGSVPAAHAARMCRPPTGPGDDLVHSGGVHARNLSCAKARRLMIVCDRFSYGHKGHCRAVGFRWYCTSARSGFLGSTEACTARGRRRVSWYWTD